jgi:hypothetical protein
VNERTELPGQTGSLTGLRVLFLPKNSRTGFFRSFLRTARERCGWRIQVPCPVGSERVWHEAIGAQGTCVAMPDFNAAADWESDAQMAGEIDAFIAACERANGVSAGRVVLAGERELGRGFSLPNFYWFHDRTARRVLADNTEPNRIVRRMFAFARATLSAAHPDLVLAGEWADPVCFVFYLVARHMGVPAFVNRRSKLWSGRCYWSSDLAMYNEAACAEADKLESSNASVSARARDRIASFREGPQTLGYVKENWNELDRRGWLGSHVEIARLLAVKLRRQFDRQSAPPTKPALRLLWDIYRRAWLTFQQSGFFRRFSSHELRDMRYILIALHKDPEQALNHQAFIWSNQLNTVSLLSSSLPDGVRLLVREHRSNAGRRPTQYYKDMRRLPGVVLIDGHDDQFKYIRNADLIVTDNGTTGWEGLVLGRPVITLADTYYDAAGLARRVNDHDQLGGAVLELLGQAAVADLASRDALLGHVLDAEWHTSAPLDEEGHAGVLALLNDQFGRISRAPAAAKPIFA